MSSPLHCPGSSLEPSCFPWNHKPHKNNKKLAQRKWKKSVLVPEPASHSWFHWHQNHSFREFEVDEECEPGIKTDCNTNTIMLKHTHMYNYDIESVTGCPLKKEVTVALGIAAFQNALKNSMFCFEMFVRKSTAEIVFQGCLTYNRKYFANCKSFTHGADCAQVIFWGTSTCSLYDTIY